MSETKLDGLLNTVETGAASALDNVGKMSDTISADLPGVAAKLVASLHVLQTFAVQAHALLGQFFPNNNLPHPTAEGATDASQINSAITASVDANT